MRALWKELPFLGKVCMAILAGNIVLQFVNIVVQIFWS